MFLGLVNNGVPAIVGVVDMEEERSKIIYVEVNEKLFKRVNYSTTRIFLVLPKVAYFNLAVDKHTMGIASLS